MKLHIVFFVLIACLAFFLRFWQLGNIPNGFYQDESAIGYNAYSIMQTGKDEHGQPYPLYFKSFGDYKLPVYIYSTTIPIYFFGLNEFAVRFPSAFFGFLSVIVIYFFTFELTKKRTIALVSMLLLSINPWSLHYNRATFEVSISLFLYLAGSWCLLRYFIQKNKGMFILGTLIFAASIYTYNLTRLLSPVLFCWILYSNRSRFSFRKKEISIGCVAGFLLLIPFLFSIIQKGGISSASGTLIFSSAPVLSSLLEFRSYLVSFPDIFVKPFFNMNTLIAWQYIQNIASYFSVPFFFVSGSPHGNHGIGNVGLFYVFELITIVVGFIAIWKEKKPFRTFLVGWAIIVILIAALTRDVPHATRSFFLLVPFIIWSSYGFILIANTILSIKKTVKKIVIAIVACLFVFYAVIFYFVSYYVRFPALYASSWRQQDKAVSVYIKENNDKYDRVIFDKKAGFVYPSLLFFQKYSPSEFLLSVKRAPDDSEGFSEVVSFGKFEFRDIDWSGDLKNSRTLIITSPKERPEGVAIANSFLYPLRPVVFAIKQEIVQYPIQDTAYVAIENQ